MKHEKAFYIIADEARENGLTMFSLARLRFVNIIAKKNFCAPTATHFRSSAASRENGRRETKQKTFKCVIADSDCLRERELLFMSFCWLFEFVNIKRNKIQRKIRFRVDFYDRSSIRFVIESHLESKTCENAKQTLRRLPWRSSLCEKQPTSFHSEMYERALSYVNKELCHPTHFPPITPRRGGNNPSDE